MASVKVSFHKDPVVVQDLCAALESHGCVFWHTSRPNFSKVADLVEVESLEVVRIGVLVDGEYANFLIRPELVTSVGEMRTGVAKAIQEWSALGAPVPHTRAV